MRETLSRRIDAAQGKVESDLLITNIRYLDVFSCEWRKGEIAVIDGVIVGIEPGLKAKRVVDGKGRSLVPGFVDAHVHVESSMMLPPDFEAAVLPKGTTTAICDPHELTNVIGVSGLEYFLESASRLQMDLWVMLSSCVPATHLETNGGGVLKASHLRPFKSHARALGLAEMMNVPGVLFGDPDVLEKISTFSDVPLDGHSPLVTGQALSAYAAAGITSCHESSQLPEAQEKLTKGMSVWIREGSVAKDLQALAPLLNAKTSSSIGFCTDDRNPFDIETEGHLDHLIRGAIRVGVEPEIAYRSASWSVARHYGLDRGPRRVGAIAPGYDADFVLLEDAQTCSVGQVFKKGNDQWTRAGSVPRSIDNTVRANVPAASDLEGPSGSVHVVVVEPGKIITGRRVANSSDPEILRLSVLERYGNGLKPANAYVTGFGALKGAIASSVGHDSHNLIVVGSDAKEMRVALGRLIETGGGFCVVQNQSVLADLPLPFGGLMTDASPQQLSQEIRKLKGASESIGCTLPEPFLQLAFLSLPVIPSLKLTDKGLVDVEAFDFISVSA